MNPIYDAYLRSSTWQAKRQQVLERDGWQCRGCDAIAEGRYLTEDLQVHHRHYRHFGDEPLEDLTTLCPECHDAITSVHRRRRYSARDMQATDIERTTPKLTRKAKANAPDIEISTTVGLSHPAPQRSDSRPTEQIFQSDETNLIETFQDGRGLRGDGASRVDG